VVAGVARMVMMSLELRTASRDVLMIQITTAQLSTLVSVSFAFYYDIFEYNDVVLLCTAIE